MYDYIRGQITELTPAYAVVEAGGVGYHIIISLNTFSAIEKASEAKLYVHYTVREDAHTLHGFADRGERELFRLLIGVSGVGGNTARMILSTYSPSELASIISSSNAGLLKNVKGLGLKTSEKIIVELRDKMGGALAGGVSLPPGGQAQAGGVYDESLAALTMLGFQKAAAGKVVAAILKENPTASVEEAVRVSLKKL